MRPLPGGCRSRDLSAADYRQVGEILQRGRNFSLAAYKELYVRRRLAARIRASGSVDLGQYLRQLAASPEEQEALLAALSIQVSEFFRNPSVFRALEADVLPPLLSRLRERRQGSLRIWSCGCARGEEAYSLALLIRPCLWPGEKLSLLATDKNAQALAAARCGRYPGERVKQVPVALAREYLQLREGQIQVDDRIRAMIRFFQHDLLTDRPFSRSDLILCRNLLIYLSREQQEHALNRLAKALRPGGFLILGRAESLVPAGRHLFQCCDSAERIYRRLDN
jgi:chemotaxis protein methyltransferase CheR